VLEGAFDARCVAIGRRSVLPTVGLLVSPLTASPAAAPG
jgi:hypothetical protein